MPKCADCGFLSLRLMDDRTLVSAHDEFRKTGNVSLYGESPYSWWPVCFLGVLDLEKKCESESGAIDADRVLAVIQEENDCSQFTLLSHGSSPKEHIEMLRLEQDRKWQEERLKADQRWRDEHANRAEEFRVAQAKQEHIWRTEEAADRKRDITIASRNAWIALVSVVVISVVSLLAAIIGNQTPEPPMVIVQPNEIPVPNVIVVIATPTTDQGESVRGEP